MAGDGGGPGSIGPGVPTTLVEAAAALRSGELTSEALVDAVLHRADQLDGLLGVYLARFDDEARAAARQADAELARGQDRGPLHGIPMGVKDLLATREGPTTAQCLALDHGWQPGTADDAGAVSHLRRAGAVVTGKTTLMELACGVPDPSSPFPLPRNPWDPGTWPGGSSSGSGAGVAAGMFLAALGTETGGSIRMPAAFCGITGHKPTYGLVGRSRTVPLAYSLDHVGPLTRSAHDAALVLDAIAGPDAGDADAVGAAPGAGGFAAGLGGSLEGVRVGVDRSDLGPDADPAVAPALDAALAQLLALGADVVEVEVPLHPEGKAVSLAVFVAEAFACHRTLLLERWGDLGMGTRVYLALGALLASGDYVAAQRVRRLLGQRLRALLGQVDLVVSPTTTAGAPRFDDAGHVDLATLVDHVHTMYWASTGFPITAVPMGRTAAGLPLSLQIGGRPFDDRLVLRAADAYQRHTVWHLAAPPLVADLVAPGAPILCAAPAATPSEAPGPTPPERTPDEPAAPSSVRATEDVARAVVVSGLPAAPDDVAAITAAAKGLADGVELLHAALAGSDVWPATGFRPEIPSDST